MILGVRGSSLCLFVLAACSATDDGGMGDRWESLPPSEATIQFDAPGLDDQRVRHLRSDNMTAKSTLELAIWTGVATRHPKARVLYVEAWPRYHFRAGRAPGSVVESDDNFKDKELVFGASGEGRNAFGPVRTRRFVVDSAHCVAFIQYWGQSGSETTSTGTNSLQGYYCADPGQELWDATISAAVRSLGIGEAAQPKAAITPIRLPLRVTLAAPGKPAQVYSGRISVTDEARVSAFDLHLDWPYGDCSGQSEHRAGKFGEGEVEGVWNVICVNGETASGLYWGRAPDRGRGEGRASDGATIEFRYGEDSAG